MPHVELAMPAGGRSGETVQFQLRGVNLAGARRVTVGDAAAQGEVAGAKADVAEVRINLPRGLAPGVYKLHVGGAGIPVPFVAGGFQEVTVADGSARSRRDPAPVALPWSPTASSTSPARPIIWSSARRAVSRRRGVSVPADDQGSRAGLFATRDRHRRHFLPRTHEPRPGARSPSGWMGCACGGGRREAAAWRSGQGGDRRTQEHPLHRHLRRDALPGWDER